MQICAAVLEVNESSLLVCDNATFQFDSYYRMRYRNKQAVSHFFMPV